MKNKIVIFFIYIFIAFIMMGCGVTANNDINNKVYNVDIDLTKLDEAFIPAVERASESTLGITSYSRKSLLQSWTVVSVGSCVIYETTAVLDDDSKLDYSESLDKQNVKYYEYKAITNAHVLKKENSFMKYTVYDGETNSSFELTVLGKDESLDLAVVSFRSAALYIPIQFSKSIPSKGQVVLAIGNANGYEYYSSATMGIVSYPNRLVNENGYSIEYIQHDAAINPGNSGGALVNINGELMGINTSKIVDTDIDGMGFAIPVGTVLSVISRLEDGKSIDKLSTGLAGKTINDLRLDAIFNEDEYILKKYEHLEYGFIVNSVAAQSIFSPYIKAEDVILEINSNKVFNSHVLKNSVMLLEKEDTINIKILRQKEIIDVTIEI